MDVGDRLVGWTDHITIRDIYRWRHETWWPNCCANRRLEGELDGLGQHGRDIIRIINRNHFDGRRTRPSGNSYRARQEKIIHPV